MRPSAALPTTACTRPSGPTSNSASSSGVGSTNQPCPPASTSTAMPAAVVTARASPGRSMISSRMSPTPARSDSGQTSTARGTTAIRSSVVSRVVAPLASAASTTARGAGA